MGNSKIEEFKSFVRANPFLIGVIRRKEKSWQDLFEVYDMYGSNYEVWNKYLDNDREERYNSSSKESSNGFSGYMDEFIKMAKNVDVDKVQEGINSLQKTLALFGDLFVNKEGSAKGYNPRPLYKRFED